MKIGITGSGTYPGHDYVRQVEALGFDSFWTAEHFVYSRPVQDVLPVLGAVAALTSRVTIGSAITLLPFYNPVMLAKSFSTIDLLSGGRVVAGVGVGGDFAPEFAACGVPRSGRGERSEAMIDVMRALWLGETVSNDGSAGVAFEGAFLDPLPARTGGPPIWIAGRSQAAQNRARRLGDGFLPYLVSRQSYADRVRQVLEQAEKEDRPLRRGFEWALRIDMAGGRDRQAMKALMLRSLHQRFGSAFGADHVERYTITGTWDDCREELAQWTAAGVTHILMQPVAASGEELDYLFEVADELGVRRAKDTVR
jgi:alkanesulfonate monooxygenase SsuD/methylene tetrahydromethanopterin reductase-like flavin-dependent oxidoreductase (luciferase family)